MRNTGIKLVGMLVFYSWFSTKENKYTLKREYIYKEHFIWKKECKTENMEEACKMLSSAHCLVNALMIS